MPHLNAALSQEIKRATKGLPLYKGGPEVDYTDAQVAYAVNVTVVFMPGFNPAHAQLHVLTAETPALLVRRASGHGVIGSWSGVSGYISMINDPAGCMDAEDFDPIHYTICAELGEECGLTAETIDRLSFYLGERFCEAYSGGELHVVPVLAVYSGVEPPTITPNIDEVSDYAWVSLGHIAAHEDIGAGYLKDTLPRVLRAIPHP